jgi:addiction module HigA family antidote
MTKKLHPVHPGEILTEDFLNPMHLTAYGVAAMTGVPRTRIERLAHQKTAMTADTALRLGRFFGVSAAFWMNIQARYDLERAEDDVATELANITPYHHEAA